MAMSPKILSLDELARRLQEVRSASGSAAQRVIHCHGVFDLLHIGHIRYLQHARQLGDLLIVTITPDHYVNKGPHRPAFQEKLRADALAALDCVDYVAINEWQTACEAIRLLRPDVYAKGVEFREHKTPELLAEEEAARDAGAGVEFIEEVTSSSSHLLNKYLTPFEEETELYLRELRQRVCLDDVLGWLDRTMDVRVLVVGETIIDEYYSCSAIGRSAKAPILATRYDSHDRFAGGAIAIANHLAAMCQRVDLLSMLGQHNSEEEWLETQLADNVQARFLCKQGSPTIIKRRYRESYFGTPLFAINFLSEAPLLEDEEHALREMLSQQLNDYDMVLVADYGHQMLTESVVRLLTQAPPFLAVNTQANAANTGFHTISKYPRADYVALAERELQLECRSQTGNLQDQLAQVGNRLKTQAIVVTLGKQGCLCYDPRAGYHRASSLATNVVDRVGAGDAFFAISALCAVLRAPLEILAFLGNVAGAEAVATLGNSRSIDRDSLKRHIESIFK